MGSVVGLARFPLKSAAPEVLAEIEAGSAGLLHDRRWAFAQQGELVPGKAVPALADVPARVVDDALQVQVGGWRSLDDRVLRELSARLGLAEAIVLDGATAAGSDLQHAGGHHKVAAVHLVSAGAATAPGAPTGCDPDPRANIAVRLHRPGAERDWVGRRLGLGDVVLGVSELPRKCLGVYCTVVRPGRLRVGADVRLLP